MKIGQKNHDVRSSCSETSKWDSCRRRRANAYDKTSIRKVIIWMLSFPRSKQWGHCRSRSACRWAIVCFNIEQVALRNYFTNCCVGRWHDICCISRLLTRYALHAHSKEIEWNEIEINVLQFSMAMPLVLPFATVYFLRYPWVFVCAHLSQSTSWSLCLLCFLSVPICTTNTRCCTFICLSHKVTNYHIQCCFFSRENCVRKMWRQRQILRDAVLLLVLRAVSLSSTNGYCMDTFSLSLAIDD